MNTIDSLFSFIREGTSPFHVVRTAKSLLQQQGFRELNVNEDWNIEPGKAYFVTPFDTVLLAFTVGADTQGMLRIAAAHVDYPCLRVKPSPEIQQDGYAKLNIETYGGLILNTWLDRPLSCAGKVVVTGRDVFSPKAQLIDWKRPLFTIPNLAIHMNRKINDGVALNKQVDLLPLAGMADDTKNYFTKCIADTLGYPDKDILSYDLTVYPAEEPCVLGWKNDLISSPRLDNLTSVMACLQGILRGRRSDGVNCIALFDNEEVGSRTKQGAASVLLTQVLERCYAALGYDRQAYLQAQAGGFLLSMDVAHGVHPNHDEKSDVTNKPVLNGGVVLKMAASQSYVGDAESVAIVRGLCRMNQIRHQVFVNRSDEPGGSTLGSIASTVLPMRAMDVGVPLLAMHSARETMGASDQEALEALTAAFFAAHS
jgi:aspartyl aminopeptidase